MQFHVSLASGAALGEQIYRQLYQAIAEGRLRPGERLPPTRDLALRLGVARNTVSSAYERLTAEGLLVGRTGSGSYVTAERLPSIAPSRAPAGVISPRSIWRRLEIPATDHPAIAVAHRRGAVAYDFAVGVPDPTLFPYTPWRRLLAAQFRTPSARDAAYGDSAGLLELRDAIARHAALSRAVHATAADVIVTNGAQQAFDLIGQVLLSGADHVAVEEPGYPFARLSFERLGTRIHGVPVDDEGIVVQRIPSHVRLVYVTPSHQFPRGSVMSLKRRAELLSWAERRRSVIVEDDYDSEFRFADRSLDPLQSLDRGGRVIYVGSFSKVLLPTLRLGFLIAPVTLQAALRSAQQLASWHPPLATQAALAGFINGGGLARHVRKVSREYAERHRRIVAGIERYCGKWLRVIPSAAGLHVAAELKRPTDLAAVVRRASDRGVNVRRLGEFALARRGKDGVVIGYGAIPVFRIDEGLQRLATSFRETK